MIDPTFPHDRRSAGWLPRRPMHLVAACVAVVLGCPPAGAQMRIHFIDVGQGAATLIEFPCAAVLVDTGSEDTDWTPWVGAREKGSRKLFAYLDGFFAGRTDLGGRLHLLVLSHPHVDHTRNVRLVTQKYTPHAVLHNGQRSGSGRQGQRELKDYAVANDVPQWFVRSDLVPAGGLHSATIDPVDCTEHGDRDPRIVALAGKVQADPGWGADSYGLHFDDENNHSVVLRVEYGQAAVLFMGDLETPAIDDLVSQWTASGLLDADVLQVGHHGSENGITIGLLDAVSPKVAVIGAGQPCRRKGYSAWSHGHPRKDVVHTLASVASESRPSVQVRAATGQKQFEVMSLDRAVYSTGWDGHVVVTLDAQGRVVDVRTTPQAPVCN